MTETIQWKYGYLSQEERNGIYLHMGHYIVKSTKDRHLTIQSTHSNTLKHLPAHWEIT